MIESARAPSVSSWTGPPLLRASEPTISQVLKMENYVHAPADATVADIPVSAGRTVAAGEVLVRMRPARSEQED